MQSPHSEREAICFGVRPDEFIEGGAAKERLYDGQLHIPGEVRIADGEQQT